jgi:hypothetical protein
MNVAFLQRRMRASCAWCHMDGRQAAAAQAQPLRAAVGGASEGAAGVRRSAYRNRELVGQFLPTRGEGGTPLR